MKKIKTLITIVILVICTGARADDVKDKLDKLSQTIQQIQNDSIQRNEKVAAALATIEQVKQEYQAIQGTIDANSHLIRGQQEEMMSFKRDLGDRLAAIEEKLEIYDRQITKAVEKVAPKAANEAESYQKGLDLVQNSDFLTAVASFRGFMKAYPKSDLAGNAQYWIGECYYALKDYPKAIREFEVVVAKYPGSDKVAGAILKQGYSFAEMGMPDDAKLFLNKVIKAYPNSDEAARAREKIAKIDQKAATPAAPAVNDATKNIPLAPGVRNAR